MSSGQGYGTLRRTNLVMNRAWHQTGNQAPPVSRHHESSA